MTDYSLSQKRLSVVIPTFNRIESLSLVLSGLAKQTVPPGEFEVIIVSDGSIDGTDEMIEEIDVPFDLNYFRQANAGPSAARNRAIDESNADIIVFMDDDLVPGAGCLLAHLNFHDAEPAARAAIGPMIRPPDFELQPWTRWEQKMLDRQYDEFATGGQVGPRNFYTANVSMRRADFVAVGGFDRTLRRGEDVEFAYRLADHGVCFSFLPEAEGCHHARRPFESWAQSASIYGETDVALSKAQGRSWLRLAVASEFLNRHLLVRGTAWLTIGHPVPAKAVERLLTAVGRKRSWVVPEPLGNAALSGVFNMRYYSAFADALGGRREFFALVDNARHRGGDHDGD